MKKRNIFLQLAAVVTVLLCMSACKVVPLERARADIMVTLDNAPQSGAEVYMFTKGSWDLFNRDPFFAEKSVVADSDGVARIEIGSVHFIGDKQTTFYFAVLDGDEVIGQTALTIKSGQKKTATLKLDWPRY